MPPFKCMLHKQRYFRAKMDVSHTQILSSLLTNNYKPRIITGLKLLENNQVLIIVLNDFKFQNQTILYSFNRELLIPHV